MRHGGVKFIAILFVAAASASGATTVPATTRGPAGAAAAVPNAREILRAIDNLAAPAPLTCKWADLVRLSVHDGRLMIESRVSKELIGDAPGRKALELEIEDATDRFWRLQAIPQPGMAVPAGVPLGPMPAGAPRVVVAAPRPRAPGAIDFYVNARIRGQGDAPRLTTVMLMAGSFRLGGRLLNDERFYVVDFRSYTNKSNVTLSVRENTRGRRPRSIVALDAPDLQQLRRNHPAEVRTYLEPLMSEVCGGVSPLRPRAADVYRVFASIPADSQTLSRVKKLVGEFDALEPDVREAASRQLELLGRAGVLAATRVDRTDLSGEQMLRLDSFLSRNSTMADVSAAGEDLLFLTDCLGDADRAVRAAALTQLRRVSGREIEFDVDAPADQRAAAGAAVASEFFPLKSDVKSP